MILVAGSAFAAETPVLETPPVPERPIGEPPSDRLPINKTEAFWENLIEESEEDNDQLAADNSVPP
jgi:hypothetical protein